MNTDCNGLNDVDAMLQNDEDYCVVCLDGSTESAPLITPSSFFVSDCKCRYLAHKKCMTKWVMKQINSNKQMLCPNCNSKVSLAVDYDYRVVLQPQDVRFDMSTITRPPRTRRQKIYELISEIDKCTIICGCFYCASFLMFLVFVYILK